MGSAVGVVEGGSMPDRVVGYSHTEEPAEHLHSHAVAVVGVGVAVVGVGVAVVGVGRAVVGVGVAVMGVGVAVVGVGVAIACGTTVLAPLLS